MSGEYGSLAKKPMLKIEIGKDKLPDEDDDMPDTEPEGLEEEQLAALERFESAETPEERLSAFKALLGACEELCNRYCSPRLLPTSGRTPPRRTVPL